MNFMIIFGLTVLCIVVILFVFNFHKKNTAQKNKPVEELKIENVGKGAALSFTGIGPELLDFDVIVERRHTYKEGSLKWFEIECMAGGSTYWLEVFPGEDVELSITYKKLSLKDIHVSTDELYKMDEKESGTVAYNKIEYSYVDSGHAIYLEDSREEKAERYYYWDFESKDMKQHINIEKWSDGKFEVNLAESVNESQITIYS